MRTGMYAVYDVKAEIFNVPFFMPRDAMAIRAFSDLANNPETSVGRHLEDYKLVKVAEFDDVQGVVVPCEHVTLGWASDFRVNVQALRKVD